LDLFIEEVKITNTTTILDAAREITPICCKDLHRPKLTASNLPRYEGESNCKNPNITVTKGDLENIPFEDNYFDFVYMTDAIHHIPDIEMMFKEIGRVSKKVETFA